MTQAATITHAQQTSPPVNHLTLAAVRDESNTVERLGAMAGRSAEFAAGLVDAVEGNSYFADCLEECESDPCTIREYRDGFAAGQAMLDMEAGIVESTVPAWQLIPIDPMPCPAWDVPF